MPKKRISKYFLILITISIILSTIPIQAFYGDITGAVIDTYEFNQNNGNWVDMVRLGSSEYYLIATSGVSNDGFVNTTRVYNSNGTIKKSSIDYLEYDTTNGYYNALCWVSGDIYAVAYEDGTNTKIRTFKAWSSNGTIGSAYIDTLTLKYFGYYLDILKITDRIVAVTYQNGTGNAGWLETVYIDSSGDIGATTNDSVCYNSTGQYWFGRMCNIDSDTMVIVYDEITTNDCWAITYDISSTGDISSTYKDRYEFEPTTGYLPNIRRVAGNTYAVSYQASGPTFTIKTFNISSTGTFTKSIIDTLTKSSNCQFSTIIPVNNLSVYAITYKGTDNDGFVDTFNMTSTGIMDSVVADSFEFETTNNTWFAPICYVNKSYYCIAYTGTGNDGYIVTVEISTNYGGAGGPEPPVQTSPSPTNGSTGEGLEPTCSIAISDPDGDLMKVYWYENSTGSWILRQTNTSCTNGTYRWIDTYATSVSTTYWWKVSVNDTIYNTTRWYKFSTYGLPAGSIYVSPTGSDSSGNGSIGNPYKTLQKAINVSVTGSNIYLRQGKYPSVYPKTTGYNINKGGTTANPYVVAGYPGEKAVLDGTGFSIDPDYGLIHIGDMNNHYHNITLDNLWITNSSQRGFIVYSQTATGPCHDIRITNCTFYNIHENAITFYAEGSSTTNWFRRAFINNCTFDTCQNDESMGEITTLMYCRDFNISYNTYVNCRKIQFILANGCCYGQVFRNNHNIDSHHTGEAIYLDNQGYNSNENHHIRIHNNTIWGNAEAGSGNYGIAVCNEVSGSCHHIIIENNIINRTGQDGAGEVYAIGIKHGQYINNITIRHNTIYQWTIDSPAVRVYSSAGDNFKDIVFANNIFLCTGNTATRIRFSDLPSTQTNVSFYNNSYYRTDGTTLYHTYTTGSTSGESSKIIGDPKVTSTVSGDFHLLSSSPCIDKGKTTYKTMKDFDGVIRPQGSGYDVGAFEYFAGPVVTTNDATGITNGNATLWGFLNDDGGSASTVCFEYGTTTSYGYTTSTQSKTTGQYFSVNLGSLAPATKYYFRAKATTNGTTSYGGQKDFTTTSTIPVVTTTTATEMKTGSIKLNGYLNNDGGGTSNCNFEYGLTTSYGTQTITVPITSGHAWGTTITGLTAGTTYHFRAKANTSGNVGYGADMYFTLPNYPTVTTNSTTAIGTTYATVTGFLYNKGGTVNCNITFEYGFTTSYGSTSAIVVKTTTGSTFQILTGLVSGALYHYRIKANNGFYITNGTDKYFTTLTGGTTTISNPKNFNTIWTTASSLYFTWSEGTGSTGTKLIRKINSYPDNIADGTIVYNGSGTAYNDTGISPSIRYFYRAYGFNTTSYSTGTNIAVAETDNTTSLYSTWIDFKGYIETDKTFGNRFIYSQDSLFGNTNTNYTYYQVGLYNCTPYWGSGGPMPHIYLSNYNGQSFKTGSDNFYITNVTAWFKRKGSPGLLHASLYLADASWKPTGSILASGTTNGNTISTTGEWVNITMSKYRCLANTMYCIVYYTGGSIYNYIEWATNQAGDYDYPNGNAIYGTPPSFSNLTSKDHLFKIWGNEPTTYASGQYSSYYSRSTTGNVSIMVNGLNSGTLYYYRMEGNDTNGNLTRGNRRFSLTNPGIPIFNNLVPYYANNSVYISWIKGLGANRTVIVRGNTSYPTTVYDGTIIYNGTGTSTWYHNISFNQSYKFSLFSYTIWDGLFRFSSGTTVPWGGISFNCFNESSGLPIRFNILITNGPGDETYYATNLYGWQTINVSSIPYGENTVFYITNGSKLYNPRTYYKDIETDTFYNFSFYLPMIDKTKPPGENKSYLYYLHVVYSYVSELYSYDEDIQGAHVTIKRYVPTTAKFVTVADLLTDASGFCNVYLIPGAFYKVFLTADGFEDGQSDYVPAPPNDFGQTEVKVFKMIQETTGGTENPVYTFWDNSEFYAVLYENNTIHVIYEDRLCSTESMLFKVYQEYNGTLLFLNQRTSTESCGYDFWTWVFNASKVHKVLLNVSNSKYGYFEVMITIQPWQNTTEQALRRQWIEDVSKAIFGTFPPGYVNFFLIFLPCLIALLIPGHKNIEVGIVLVGFVLGLVSTKISLPGAMGIISPLIVIIGIIYALAKRGKEKL